MEADDRRYLILAHVGNSSDGLQKLYLCEPGKVMDGMIVGWAGYQEIYNQTTDLAPAPVMESRGEAAPTEVVEDFELKPKAAKQTRSIPSKA